MSLIAFRRMGRSNPVFAGCKVVSACALLALALLTSSAIAQTYGVGTMQPGTLSNSTGSAIAKVMQQKLSMQTRVQPSAGESTLLPLVNNGETDLGIANILEVVAAFEGKAVAGKQDKLRIVSVIHPLRVGFFVRKDSPIKTMADLKGKRVPLGFSAMGTINTLALAMLATAGMTENDVKPVLVPNVIRSADDFINGSAEAFFFALGAGKVNEVDASVGGIRIVDMPDTPEGMAAARKIFPYMYLTELTPRPGLTGVTGPVKVTGYDNLLVTSTATKDDVIYKIIDGLLLNKADLAATAPWLREMTSTDMYKNYPVPYHPGAVKYFADKGVVQR
jgi:TRAP transporter TAXI family solute receptor